MCPAYSLVMKIEKYIYRETDKFPLVDGHWFYGDFEDVADREKLLPGIALRYSEGEGKSETLFFLCPCGCGSVCNIPIRGTGWQLSHGANGPTLTPSVSCVGQECKSHFYIRDGRVDWC